MIRSRRAVSLVELLVVMSACTAVLTLTGELLCRIMRIQIESRALVDVERNTLRLSDQFRSDVHQAQSAVTNEADLADDVFLQLRFSDGRQAEYSRHERIVLRRLSGKGSQVSREEFAFPAACDLAIQEAGTPPRLILTITVKPSQAPFDDGKPLVAVSMIPISLQVESLLGRDLRFAAAPATEEAQE